MPGTPVSSSSILEYTRTFVLPTTTLTRTIKYSETYSNGNSHRLSSSTPFPATHLAEALTTLFTPPPDCSNPSAYATTYHSNNHYVYQLDSGIQRPSCYPSGYSSIIEASSYFSPGVCPLSYEYVSTSTTRGTTIAVCCPCGLHTRAGFSCTQTITAGGWLRFASTGYGATAYANPISVAWQEADLHLFEPKNAPVLALKTSGLGLNQRDGLSTGAAAGIGVAGTIGGLLLTGLVTWLVRRKYKSRPARAMDDRREKC